MSPKCNFLMLRLSKLCQKVIYQSFRKLCIPSIYTFTVVEVATVAPLCQQSSDCQTSKVGVMVALKTCNLKYHSTLFINLSLILLDKLPLNQGSKN